MGAILETQLNVCHRYNHRPNTSVCFRASGIDICDVGMAQPLASQEARLSGMGAGNGRGSSEKHQHQARSENNVLEKST